MRVRAGALRAVALLGAAAFAAGCTGDEVQQVSGNAADESQIGESIPADGLQELNFAFRSGPNVAAADAEGRIVVINGNRWNGAFNYFETTPDGSDREVTTEEGVAAVARELDGSWTVLPDPPAINGIPFEHDGQVVLMGWTGCSPDEESCSQTLRAAKLSADLREWEDIELPDFADQVETSINVVSSSERRTVVQTSGDGLFDFTDGQEPRLLPAPPRPALDSGLANSVCATESSLVAFRTTMVGVNQPPPAELGIESTGVLTLDLDKEGAEWSEGTPPPTEAISSFNGYCTSDGTFVVLTTDGRQLTLDPNTGEWSTTPVELPPILQDPLLQLDYPPVSLGGVDYYLGPPPNQVVAREPSGNWLQLEQPASSLVVANGQLFALDDQTSTVTAFAGVNG